MAKPAFLEAFEVIEGGASSEPSDDWVAGHAAGLAEALANHQSDQQALSAELIQTLSDMSFGYHEAHGHLQRSLEPLFAALVSGFLPRFAAQMLIPMLTEELMAMATADLNSPIALCVSPGQVDAVGAAIAQLADFPIVLRPDPTLSAGQAILRGTSAETLLDFDELLTQSQGILSALVDAPSQRSEHG